MHKIILKNKNFYMIPTDKFIYYVNLWKKEKIIVLNNEDAFDTFEIKRIIKITDQEKMIYNLLKDESDFINRSVNDEIKVYCKQLTPGVVESMILKYK